MLIKDLPEVIKKRALECQKEQGKDKNEKSDLSDGYDTFVWKRTKEGHDLWYKVNDGNFQPFYDFHKISPVAEWMPKEGEMVEVSRDEDIWLKRAFVYKYKSDYICESGGYSEWPYIRKIPVSLTRTEIAEKFGVSKDFEFVEE